MLGCLSKETNKHLLQVSSYKSKIHTLCNFREKKYSKLTCHLVMTLYERPIELLKMFIKSEVSLNKFKLYILKSS